MARGVLAQIWVSENGHEKWGRARLHNEGGLLHAFEETVDFR